MVHVVWGVGLLVSAAHVTSAQGTPRLEFAVPDGSIDLRDGLPSSQVLRLFQDRTGAIWAGTQHGLAMIGGPRLEVFTTHEGLGRNWIQAIAEDADGRLIVATQAGLSRRNGERFEPLLGAGGAAIPPASDLAITPDGTVLVLAGRAALFSLRPHGSEIERVALLNAPAFEAVDITTNAQGDLWIATRGHGLLQFSPLADAYRMRRAWTVPITGERSFDRVEARGERVVTSTARGVMVIEGSRERFVAFSAGSAAGHRAVALDPSGRTFVGTNAGIFEVQETSIVPLISRNDRATQPVVQLLADHEGQLWSGTTDAGLKVILNGRGVRFLRRGTEGFRTIVVDSRGYHWISNERRALRFRQSTNSEIEAVSEVAFSGTPTSALQAMAEMKSGDLLFALDGGVGRIASNEREMPRPTIRIDSRFPELSGQFVSALALDAEGRVWACGSAGLFTLSPGAARASSLRLPPGEAAWTLAIDKRGAIMLTTRSGHLLSVDATQHVIRPVSLPEAAIAEFVASAPDGGFIVSLEDGSTLFLASDGTTVEHVDGSSELANMAALSVRKLGDEVYLAAHGGDRLSQIRLGPATIDQTLLTSADLEDGDFRYLALHPGVDSQFWFSLLSGVGRLDPPTQPPAPRALVLESDAKVIEVGPRPNLLSIVPKLADAVAPRKVLYRHRLVGLADQWSTWSSDPHIQFASIAPGTYRLEVQARDRYGREAETLTREVKVRARFIETWPFLAFVSLLGIAGVRQFLQARLRSAEEERVHLEAAVRAGRADLEHANAQLQKASLTDQLSGLPNRRFFGEVVDSELKALRREFENRRRAGDEARDAIFFLLDLDRFKAINDTYGHSAGDTVIAEAARRLTGVMRDNDRIIRWGGEEFLVVSLGARRADGSSIARRLLSAVSAAPITLSLDHSAHVTTSIGFAAFPWISEGQDLPYEDVVKLADRGLYRAKRSGRNCAVGLVPVTEGWLGTTEILREFGGFRVGYVIERGHEGDGDERMQEAP